MPIVLNKANQIEVSLLRDQVQGVSEIMMNRDGKKNVLFVFVHRKHVNTTWI